MRVMLVSANREEIYMPTWPLGLSCVAVATEAAGHDIRLIDLKSTDDPTGLIASCIREHQPEVIGVSVRNIDDQSMQTRKFMLEAVRDVVADCKAQSSAPIVLGGAGYSIFPQSLLDYLSADMGIQGEGEKSFPDLIRRLERKEKLDDVSGLYIRGRDASARREFVRDLDTFRLPSICSSCSSTYDDEDFWFPVQTRRGCPLDCSYCSTGTIEGRSIRKRSPKVFLTWLAGLIDAGMKRIYFVDNTFNLPPSYARELCAGLVDLQASIRWRCIVYPGKIDESLIKLMAESGCEEISLGFESGSAGILNGMNKRFSLDDVRSMSRMCEDHGIRRMGFLMLGGPGETKKTVEESLEFADSLNLDFLKITIGIRIYPYTALERTAIADGSLKSRHNLLFPTFYMTRELDGWLQQVVQEWVAARPNWIS